LLGSVLPVWLYYGVGTVIMWIGAMPARRSLGLPSPSSWPVVFGTGACMVAAYAAFTAGLASGRVAEVTVLSTLSSGVATLLGWLVLGERLAGHQIAGVAAIIIGVASINEAG
jgi:drug/metabolite transporter (DMT)-like permease